MYSMHRDQDYWTDPMTFDPGRWRKGTGEATKLHAYTPFGWGDRTCIGASIGLSQLILLCHLFATEMAISIASKQAPKVEYHGPVAYLDDFIGSIEFN